MTDPAPAELAPPEPSVPEPDIPYVVCGLNEIPSKRAKDFRLGRIDNGEVKHWSIIVYRLGNQVYGYENQCPHEGVGLDFGGERFINDNGSLLMCGKHGALFNPGTGECIDGPCVGQALKPIKLVILDDDICVVGVELAGDEIEEEEEPSLCDDVGV